MTRGTRVARSGACVACACVMACAAAQAQAPRTTSATVGIRRSAPAARNAFSGVAASATTTTSTSMPAVEPARVAGEVLAGAYAGIGGYFIGSWAGGWAAEMLPASDGTKEQIAFATGIVGATMATAASVSAVGNIGDQTGSYSAALGGTVSGVAVGLLLNQLLYGHARLPEESDSSRMRWVEASLEALLPSIGATIAFNSTRKFK